MSLSRIIKNNLSTNQTPCGTISAAGLKKFIVRKLERLLMAHASIGSLHGHPSKFLNQSHQLNNRKLRRWVVVASLLDCYGVTVICIFAERSSAYQPEYTKNEFLSRDTPTQPHHFSKPARTFQQVSIPSNKVKTTQILNTICLILSANKIDPRTAQS